jgi:hypothetical protein
VEAGIMGVPASKITRKIELHPTTMKKLTIEDLEKVSCSGGFPGIPGFNHVPDPDDKDEPKDGGVTYTW